MTPPASRAKVLIIADGRAARDPGLAIQVRRYRLARIRLEGRPASRDSVRARSARTRDLKVRQA